MQTEESVAESVDATGPRARMKRRLLTNAMRLMQQGNIPSVTEVAAAAEVSRATAYRYFPSQIDMIQEAVYEALGSVLDWTSDEDDAEARLDDLLRTSLPRIENYEATHRGALWLAIDQWSREHAGRLGDEAPIVRGNRKALLQEAMEPLRDRMSAAEFDKLLQALSLMFGIEAFLVLKDIWRLKGRKSHEVILWAAQALVRQAVAEADAGSAGGRGNTGGKPRKH